MRLTTTIGTLLPVLRDGGQLDTPFGRQLLAAGTIGEVGLIVAVCLALSDRYDTWQEMGFLLVFLALVLGAFAAGMVVGLATRGEEGEAFRVKMDAVCFGWFTPSFFVGTGIGFDLGALTRDATTTFLIPAMLLLLLVARASAPSAIPADG